MGRLENAEVFRDTERMCRENARLRAAKTVVDDYLRAFRAIEFAVYCRPGDSANYDAFANASWGA